MSNSIDIPALDFHMGERERARLNVANARYTILHEGRLLIVAIMYGMDGRIVDNPLHAFRCAVFLGNGEFELVQCTPGDVVPRRKYPI